MSGEFKPIQWSDPSAKNGNGRPIRYRFFVNIDTGHAYHRNPDGSMGPWAGIFHKTGGGANRKLPWVDTSVPEPKGVYHTYRAAGANLLGLNTPAAPIKASNNLLTFPSYEEQLASINFSKKAMNNANFKRFTNAGINIEEETVKKLSPNQRTSLFNRLTRINKRNQNAEINAFLQNVLSRKGGKHKHMRRHTLRKRKH